MRTVAATLAQNLGGRELGAVLDISGRITADGLGAIAQETDRELTKISPTEVSIEVMDHDDVVWPWILANAQKPDGTGLLPLLIRVQVGGEPALLGLVDPAQASRDRTTMLVTLNAKDWSVLLAKSYLDGWTRPLPRAISDRPAEADKLGFSPSWCVPNNFVPPEYWGWGKDANLVYFQEPNNWVQVGDQVISDLRPGETFKVIALLDGPGDTSGGGGYILSIPTPNFTVVLDGSPWLTPEAYYALKGWDGYYDLRQHATITRLSSSTTEQNYFVVTAPISGDSSEPAYRLSLDTIDGVVPGDELQTVLGAQTTTISVLQVDADLKQVISRDPLPALAINDRLQFTDKSVAELVFVDARQALQRAAGPFPVDLTRYVPSALPVPVLSWLPLRAAVSTSDDLMAVRDLEPTLDGLRVFGVGAASWDGLPETGWAASVGGAHAPWTGQLLDAPASLMPDETTTLVPTAPRRNRAYDPRWRAWTDLSLADPLNADWDPSGAATPAGLVVYDYLQMRRVKIVGNSVTTDAWTGSAWGAHAVEGWPGGAAPLSACVLPDAPGAVVALLPTGLQLATFPGGASTAVLPIPGPAADAVLVATPYGAYLVGSMGYGRVTYSGGALHLAWVTLGDANSQFYPGSFCAYDADTVFVLARFQHVDRGGTKTTQTRALRMQATPTTADNARVWDEAVLDGAPVTLGAMRAPDGRIVGHLGGRLFQVSAARPVGVALERFAPAGMTSAEFIEHVCQVVNAIAYPDANGVLHVVSRALTEAPVNLTVDQVSIKETRAWDQFFSLVRVGGQGEDVYFDAVGPMRGGDVLELSGHPMLWTVGACEALALVMAAWFGVARRVQVQEWFHTDTNTAGPWEALPPLARVRINGAPQAWIVLALADDKLKGRATATLLEVV